MEKSMAASPFRESFGLIPASAMKVVSGDCQGDGARGLTIGSEAAFVYVGKELLDRLDGECHPLFAHGKMSLPEVHFVLAVLAKGRVEPFDIGAETDLVVQVHREVGSKSRERCRVGAGVEKVANGGGANSTI